jgi:hypothetical protein
MNHSFHLFLASARRLATAIVVRAMAGPAQQEKPRPPFSRAEAAGIIANARKVLRAEWDRAAGKGAIPSPRVSLADPLETLRGPHGERVHLMRTEGQTAFPAPTRPDPAAAGRIVADSDL